MPAIYHKCRYKCPAENENPGPSAKASRRQRHRPANRVGGQPAKRGFSESLLTWSWRGVLTAALGLWSRKGASCAFARSRLNASLGELKKRDSSAPKRTQR